MTYRIRLTQDMIRKSFEQAITCDPTNRTNFFADLRRTFRCQVEALLVEKGINVLSGQPSGYVRVLAGDVIQLRAIRSKYNELLDIEFCAKYGHDEYSLSAINYIDRSFCELPSLLPFVQVKNFSIGNILILIEGGDYKIEVIPCDAIRVVGYSQIISAKKRSHLCLLGIRFRYDALRQVFVTYFDNCQCREEDLDEVRIGVISYPIMYICRCCGKLYTCKCFDNYYDIDDDIVRILPYPGDEELAEHVKTIRPRDGICHLCTNGVPKLLYGHEMYYSTFLQRYLPYYGLLARQRYGSPFLASELAKDLENELRERVGYPRIGEGWVSETALFRIIETMLPGTQIIHHYRGPELQGLELDIWIPQFKIAIEYQGEQHFRVVEHWGGEEGLRKRLENDRRKRKLCKELGYRLVEFRYDESLTPDHVERKLSSFLVG